MAVVPIVWLLTLFDFFNTGFLFSTGLLGILHIARRKPHYSLPLDVETSRYIEIRASVVLPVISGPVYSSASLICSMSYIALVLSHLGLSRSACPQDELPTSSSVRAARSLPLWEVNGSLGLNYNYLLGGSEAIWWERVRVFAMAAFCFRVTLWEEIDTRQLQAAIVAGRCLQHLATIIHAISSMHRPAACRDLKLRSFPHSQWKRHLEYSW